jgi:hypothetical protein
MMNSFTDRREFLQLAAQYFALIENSSSMTCRQFLECAQQIVSKLYYLGLLLPSIEPDNDEGTTDRMSHKQWRSIYDQLRKTLAEVDLYWLVFDPIDPNDHTAIAHTLADDLSDIYRDLRNALSDKDLDGMTDESTWYIRFNFEIHWGKHAVNALSAIHSMLYGPNAIP